MTRTTEFPLAGAGGEPVDLVRTLNSHGFVDLPPMRPSDGYRSLEITLPVGRGRPRTVRIHEGRRGRGAMTILGPSVSEATAERLLLAVRHVLRMDADLSPFYAIAGKDPALAWVATGAGRMVQSPTVFEDVVKTVCTTNCAWSATVRMVSAIVEHLGEKAHGAPDAGPFGRVFPTPAAMAEAGASTGTSPAPATAAPTWSRCRGPSPTASSTSRRSVGRRPRSCPRRSSRRGCWPFPASGRTRPLTSC